VTVSSDTVADLATTLRNFARGLRTLLDGQGLPRPGSPAAVEADGELYADAWGDHPSGTVLSTILMEAWSAADHLLGAAELISSRTVSVPPYTVIRAAAESASIACYLAEDEIDPLERIRRNMNIRLAALSKQIDMVGSFTIPGAAGMVADKEKRLADIAESGQRHGFRFRPRKKYQPAYFRDEPPSAMRLMDSCASQTPRLGATYQQLLSSVAHGQLHGLAQFVMGPITLLEPEGPRTVRRLGVTAETAAQHLLIGPLCAATLVNHLGWFTGWDTDEQRALAIRMLHAWGRIAGLPYPG
jgi:hypothetical protein